MTRRRMVAALILCLGGAAAARAAEPLAAAVQAAQKRLLKPAVLRGHFTQTRTVQGLPKPLVSSGQFVLAAERGMLWITDKPLPALLRITGEGILQESGGVRRQIDLQKEPALRTVNELTLDLLRADFDLLAERFVIDTQPAPEGSWKLLLRPRYGVLASALRSVVLQGRQYVDVIELTDGRGDHTRIAMQQHKAAARLDADEEARFAD